MIDKVLDSYIKSFAEAFEITRLSEAELFEQFCNYTIISKILQSSNFDLEQISTDQAPGIDGIAIFVNDHLVSSTGEVDDLIRDKHMVARFVFIQAKTSASFDMGNINNFLSSVEDFFHEAPGLPANEKITAFRTLKDHILEGEAAEKVDGPPTCEMFYVTTGSWEDPQALKAIVNAAVGHLKGTNLFSEVNFHPIGSERLKQIHRELRNKVTKRISFNDIVMLPDIEGVEQAIIGVLPCREYLQLICDKEGELQRGLFSDNVRDFQGDTSVNLEIAETILGGSATQGKFVLLNNGITVVARSITQLGKTFTVRDFQIVNGCQTSHVLYNNRKYTGVDLYIPIKLIATTNQDITRQVIKGTNRQTEVKVEAFEAIEPFHEELEAYYGTHGAEDAKLYYERRSKQYDSDPNVRQARVVSISKQIHCFVSMFLEEPHNTIHRYYGELLKIYRVQRKELFIHGQDLYPYYLSAYALYALERFFYRGEIDRKKWRKFRYHMLLLFRVMSAGTPELPRALAKGRKTEEFCKQIHDKLVDTDCARRIFQETCRVIEKGLVQMSFSAAMHAHKDSEFTNNLIKFVFPDQALRTPRSIAAELNPHRQRGSVKKFKGSYGFITDRDGNEFSVHYSAIRGRGFRQLSEGQTVEFTPKKGQRGLIAEDVEIV